MRHESETESQTESEHLWHSHLACSELISVALLLTLSLSSLDAYFLVIFFQSCQILTGLGELALLHALPDVPMHKRALRIHQVELMIDAREDLGDGCGVADHANSPHDLGQIAARHHSRWLVIDSALEAGGAPVDKLDGALCLDCCNRCIHVLGDDVTTVHETTSHVLAVARIALHIHGCRLKD